MIRALVALVLLASPARADGVYLGLYKQGVTYFDGKRATVVAKQPRFALSLAKSATGRLWIGSTIFTYWLDGKTLDKALYMPLELRISATGVAWVANNKELAWSADGEQWHTLAMPEYSRSSSAGNAWDGLAVDDQGRAWIRFGDQLQYMTSSGKTWTTFAPPEPVKHCELAARGDLYLACWQTVYRLVANTWTKVGTLDKVSADRIVIGADGTVYLFAPQRVHVVKPGADATSFETTIRQARAFTVDDRGRLWVGHARGLTVFDAAGSPIKLPRALATKTEVTAILVEGKGPDF